MGWFAGAFGLGVLFLDLAFLLVLTKGFGLFWVVVTQSLGAAVALWLLRNKDLNLLFFLQIEYEKGEAIVSELWEDGLVLIGCLSLLLPGFLSDLLGILILLPHTRLPVMAFLRQISRGFTGDV